MTDNQDSVVTIPQTETETNLVSLSDIAEAAGLDQSIFENASTETNEESEVVTEVEEEGVAEISDEPEPETEETEETEETPDTQEPEGVKKRIGKLIEARELAKAETKKLQEELEELKGAAPAKAEQKGLARFDEVMSETDLGKRESDAEHLREWLLANPDGGDYEDSSGQEHEVDYDQAKVLIVETDRDLRKNIPLVRDRLRQKQSQDQIALKTFQWMNDGTSPEALELKAILADNKFLKDYSTKDPYAQIVLGYAVEGFKKVQSRSNPTPSNQAPSIPVAPSRAKPSVVKGKNKNSSSDLLKLAASGDIEDASKYIESLF